MSGTEKSVVTISILGRSYKIKCPQDQAASLYQAATYLDTKMRKITQSGKGITMDQAAVVVALNVAHELFTLREQADCGADDANQWIKRLAESITDEIGEENTVLA